MKTKIIPILLVMFLTLPSFAADIYVNHDGNSTSPYDTEVKAANDIQVALDAATAGDTVWIKADQNYVMDGIDQQAATFDVDVNNNIGIKGYYLTTGDQDYGGTYYKDSTNGWAVIDANSGAFNVFSVGLFQHICWHNLKITETSTSYNCFDVTPPDYMHGFLIQNCWMTGGLKAIYCDYADDMNILNCKFTGTYSTIPGRAVVHIYSNTYGGVAIDSCEFAHGNARVSIHNHAGRTIRISNNVFNISGTVADVINNAFAASIFNNVIYENSGGTITTGISNASTGDAVSIYNNIIVGCTTGISDSATVYFGGWNCFYNNDSDWTLRDGDIVADPQFMDVANGDFRLKPTSPCLNTGKSTLNSGKTTMGAWQPNAITGINYRSRYDFEDIYSD